MTLLLAAIGAAARWVTNDNVKREGSEIQFEESPSDELVVLGLER
jgi:hypothetical protein